MTRSALFAAVAFGGLTTLSAVPIAVADEAHHTVIPADTVAWSEGPPTLPAGAQLAVLLGSPAESGPFVIRLKFPAGYQVPPHWHSKDELVTVVSGKFGVGAGKTHDRDAAPLLVRGSFMHLPARMAHFAWTNQETVVQINGEGPFDITYIHPADDPRAQTQ